jgi:ribosomal protein S6
MDDTNDGLKKIGVYEIGFLLVPTIAEETVPAEFQDIKSMLEKHGGAFISEDFPKIRQLAYQMTTSTESKKSKFDQGYFGWVKFEAPADNIVKIKAELDHNPHVIRSLLISTVRENTMSAQKMAFHLNPEEAKKRAPEAKPISQEELDKTIENLVVQ